MLDAGHWMLDVVMNFSFFGLSRVQHQESSIGPHQAIGHLRRQLVGLRQDDRYNFFTF
jgi:hypothetical protein